MPLSRRVESVASVSSLLRSLLSGTGVVGSSGSNGASSLIGELTRLALPGLRMTSSMLSAAVEAFAPPATALQPDEFGVTLPLPGALPVGELGVDDAVGGSVGCCCFDGMSVGILRYEGRAAVAPRPPVLPSAVAGPEMEPRVEYPSEPVATELLIMLESAVSSSMLVGDVVSDRIEPANVAMGALKMAATPLPNARLPPPPPPPPPLDPPGVKPVGVVCSSSVDKPAASGPT